jgi:hypothetical protein
MRRVGSVLVLAIGLGVVPYGCAVPQVSVSPAAPDPAEATATETPGTTSPAEHDMTVINGTALTVTMFVNGVMIETVPAQSDRKFDPAALPERPWDLAFKTAAGRVVLDYHVEPGWPTQTVQADGSTMPTGWGKYIDLSCGRLLVLLDGFLPLPAPGPGTPGDCVA